MSLSARRAWIEILTPARMSSRLLVALRKESVDRNMMTRAARCTWRSSLSARRAWIEIGLGRDCPPGSRVALRKESVDRNLRCWMRSAHTLTVALRKESVDRNGSLYGVTASGARSLSARRAWIEIP